MVESSGLENRRCESIRGFESHSLRQLNFSIDLRKYPRGRRGSPAKGVGWIKPARGFKSLLPRQEKDTSFRSVFFVFLPFFQHQYKKRPATGNCRSKTDKTNQGELGDFSIHANCIPETKKSVRLTAHRLFFISKHSFPKVPIS